MNRDRFQQVESIFQAALKRDRESRAAFLDGACLGDEELRSEVDSLLEANEQAGSFIHAPAVEMAAALMAEEQTDSLINQSLGQYKIIAKIGAGGMGEVYLAQDTRLGRKVALKLLPDYFVSDKDRLTRFNQEARAASALNHPNIITIFEIGQVDSTHFITTEFIEGQTLRQVIANGSLKMSEALDVVIQCASALAAAHAAGIVHRDVKPENIMLRPDGIVKVLDFGLAKLTEGDGLNNTTDSPTMMKVSTSPGVVMGTASYMSPEQARGQRVDGRTDIWSLGVVLYEIITGHAPFKGETTIDVIAAIVERQPAPLARFAPATPTELQRIVMKALRKNLDERYQVTKEMLNDLRELKQELEVQARLEGSLPSEQNRDTNPTNATTSAAQLAVATAQDMRAKTGDATVRHTSSAEIILSEIKKHKLGAATIFATLIVGFAVLGLLLYSYIQRKFIDPTPGAKSDTGAQTIKITPFPINGWAREPAISPDGKYVAYALLDQPKQEQSVWVRHLPTSSVVQLFPPSKNTYTNLIFSPDSNYLYYQVSAQPESQSSYSLCKVSVIGGPPRKLVADFGPGSLITFSPDGKQLAFFRWAETGLNLMVMNEDGTGERFLASRQGHEWFEGMPSWSPDGKTIACFVGDDRHYRGVALALVAVEDSSQKQLGAATWWRGDGLFWLPDGSGLMVDGRESFNTSPQQIWRVAYPSGEVRKLTNDLLDYFISGLTADSNTLLALKINLLFDIWMTPAAPGINPTQVTFSKADGHNVNWTPNGEIIFASTASGDSSIWVMRPDGSNRRQLTGGYYDIRPTVSPDGRFIVFMSNRSGFANLWRIDSEGGNLRQLTNEISETNCPRYTPDGKWIVFRSYRSGKSVIWKMPADGGEAVQLTDHESWEPEPSPDGKLIACIDLETVGKNRALILSIEGGEPIRVIDLPADSDRPVKWTADGRALTFVASRGNASNIWKQPLEGGEPTQLTNFKPGPTESRIVYYTLSPDGKQFAVTRRSFAQPDMVLITNFK